MLILQTLQRVSFLSALIGGFVAGCVLISSCTNDGGREYDHRSPPHQHDLRDYLNSVLKSDSSLKLLADSVGYAENEFRAFWSDLDGDGALEAVFFIGAMSFHRVFMVIGHDSTLIHHSLLPLKYEEYPTCQLLPVKEGHLLGVASEPFWGTGQLVRVMTYYKLTGRELQAVLKIPLVHYSTHTRVSHWLMTSVNKVSDDQITSNSVLNLMVSGSPPSKGYLPLWNAHETVRFEFDSIKGMYQTDAIGWDRVFSMIDSIEIDWCPLLALRKESIRRAMNIANMNVATEVRHEFELCNILWP